MPVRIRLKRMGSRHRPFYRFVVMDSRNKRDGSFLEELGYYNPLARPYEVRVDEARVFDWLSKGAQISDGAMSLLRKIGVIRRWEERNREEKRPVGGKVSEVSEADMGNALS